MTESSKGASVASEGSPNPELLQPGISQLKEKFAWFCYDAFPRRRPRVKTVLEGMGSYKQKGGMTRFFAKSNMTSIRRKTKLSELKLSEIATVFGIETNREDIARLYGCRTHEELADTILDIAKPKHWHFALDPVLFVQKVRVDDRSRDRDSNEGQVPVCPETWMHRQIAAELPESSILCLSAECHSGLGFALMTMDRSIDVDYSEIIHIRPRPKSAGVEVIRTELAKALGIRSPAKLDPHFLTGLLVEQLRDRDALIVLHNAHLVLFEEGWNGDRPPSDSAQKVVRLFRKLVKSLAGKCRLVATFSAGLTPDAELLEELDIPIIKLRTPNLDLKEVEQSWQDLKALSDEYQRIANVSTRSPNLIGPTGKRLQWYLNRLSKIRAGIGPATLRLRAAGLANHRVLSAHDPTNGFRKIVGPELEALCPEFSMLYNDVAATLHCTRLNAGERQKALRMTSAGIFWFSKTVAIQLRKHCDLPDWSQFDAITSNPRRLAYFYQVDSIDKNDEQITAPFAIKCVVQDAWCRDDPQSFVTFNISLAQEMLRMAKHPPDKLTDEFPIEIPREGPAIVFYAAAAKHAALAMAVAQQKPQSLPRSVLNPIAVASSVVRDAVAAIDKRIARLLETEFGGKTLSVNHVLSRSEGRYRLKLDLLNFLSVEGDANNPLDNLPNEIRCRFHLDVGICRFGMLHLDEARAAFEAGYFDPSAERLDRFDCLMHQVSVDIVLLNFDKAEKGIREGRDFLEKLDPPDQHKGRPRLTIREANFLRAKGGKADLEAARALVLDLLNPNKLVPLAGDAAIAAVDILLDAWDANLPDQKTTLEFAMVICEANATELGQKTYPHEVGRFDIRRARVFARLGLLDAAETLLDGVALSLASDGGSERTLHEFQIACADILIRQGNAPWAYACYIHRCLERAIALDHGIGKREAGRLAKKALKACKKMGHAEIVGGSSSKTPMSRKDAIWGSASNIRGEVLWRLLADRREDVEDPFHGYDLGMLQRELGISTERLANKKVRAKLLKLAENCAGI